MLRQKVHVPRGFRPFLVRLLVVAGTCLLSGRPAGAQPPGEPTLYDLRLPGGLAAATAAAGDPLTPDRAQFLAEVIRRAYDPPGGTDGMALRTLEPLLDHLARAASAPPAAPEGAPPETLPLPMTPVMWTGTILPGSTSASLAHDILRSRDAAFLYYGLLALDEPTRAWLAGHPATLASLVRTGRGGAFVVAAPAFRVRDGRVQLPGGDGAVRLWSALAGTPASDPGAFLEAVLSRQRGRLAYFLGAIGRLTHEEVRFVLRLDQHDEESRLLAARRLFAVYERLADGWAMDVLPFKGPPLDPASLAANLPKGPDGRPRLPGSQGFWSAVFSGLDAARIPRAVDEIPAGADAPGDADFAWIAEQVFAGSPAVHRRLYTVVLFGSRLLTSGSPAPTGDAVAALRGAVRYPALVQTLERAGLRQTEAFAAVIRRAEAISGLGSGVRAARALAQFQGVLALAAHAVLRGGIEAEVLPRLVRSLAGLEMDDGHYRGRVVSWLEALMLQAAPGAEPAAESLEDALLGRLSGPSEGARPRVEWEGTVYEVDFTAAERARILSAFRGSPAPLFTAARALVREADALAAASGPGPAADAAARLASIAEMLPAAGPQARPSVEVRGQIMRLARSLTRQAGSGAARTRGARALREAADAVLAGALIEWTYAVALGNPAETLVPAADAAARHDFGLHLVGSRRTAPWQIPSAGATQYRQWHVTGSLLGLDLSLADRALVRVSSRPPARRPSIDGEARRTFAEAVRLLEPRRLTDAGAETIAAALQQGRARARGLTSAEAGAAADRARLDPVRRTLLEWLAARDPLPIVSFLSTLELLRLGLPGPDLPAALDAWGAHGLEALGCLCTALENAGAGRDRAFPDLQLRLAELLHELRMPAALLAPVLAAATFDFVNLAVSRAPHDRRGLAEFVGNLTVDKVEEYLSLLTSGGPLVPRDELDGGQAAPSGGGGPFGG